MNDLGSVVCIFCGGGRCSSTAHIIPESLGGPNSPVGRAGVTCDSCNQYFGHKVESRALRSFPFTCFRVLQGVRSKKGALPNFAAMIGTVHASGVPGVVQVDPRSEKIGRMIADGQVTQFRLLAEITEPLAVCRMLLKIGLEQLGKHFYEVAASERVGAAREFARRPRRGDRWWFIVRTDPEKCIGKAMALADLSIEIIERGGVLVSVMKLPGISTLVPLEARALPPEPGSLVEPLYRTIMVMC